MGPGHGGVDGEGPLDVADSVVLDLHRLQQPRPGAVLIPAFPPLITGLPGPVPLWNIPPRRTRPQPPQDPVHHLPMIPPPTPPPVGHRQQRLNRRPRSLGQLTTTHHTPHPTKHHRPAAAFCQTRPSGGVLCKLYAVVMTKDARSVTGRPPMVRVGIPGAASPWCSMLSMRWPGPSVPKVGTISMRVPSALG